MTYESVLMVIATVSTAGFGYAVGRWLGTLAWAKALEAEAARDRDERQRTRAERRERDQRLFETADRQRQGRAGDIALAAETFVRALRELLTSGHVHVEAKWPAPRAEDPDDDG